MRFERAFTIFLTVASAALFIGMIIVHATVLTPASAGIKAPDLVPTGYNLDGLTAWLTAMDDAAREQFIALHSVTLDLVFPFLLTWTLYRLLLMALSKLPRFTRQRRAMKIMVPLVLVLPYLVLDSVENTVVIGLLSSNQLPDAGDAVQLQTITVLKYTGVVLAFVSLIVFGLAARRTEGEK